MKKIIVVTTSYPTSDSGASAAGSFVKDFVDSLSQLAVVTVIAPSHLTQVKEESGVKVVRFGVPVRPLSLLKPFNPCHWYAIYKTLITGYLTLEKETKTVKPDHILALWCLPSGAWAKRIKKKYFVDYSVWALGSDIWSLSHLPVVKQILKSVLNGSTLCYADGFQLVNDVQSITDSAVHFLASSRILDVGDGFIKSGHPPYSLAFLGRWHKNKGIDLLLESLRLLQEKEWNLISEVVIAGGGNLSAKVTRKVNILKREGKPVILKGFLNKKMATDLIKKCDFLLLPSRVESIPVVFSDAMQCHTPVISTPSGDLKDIIETCGCGLVSREISSQSFMEAIKWGVNRPSIKNMILNTEKAMSQFSIKKSAEQFLLDISNNK